MSEIERIAAKLGATPADIPGLWWLPGYPELTTNQLLSVAVQSLPVHPHLQEQTP